MVLYRWRLKPGMERPFVEAWTDATRLLKAHAGGLGSRLHRTHDGEYLAYAMWPSEAARAASAKFETPERLRLRELMRESVAEAFPEVRLTPLADLLELCEVDAAPLG